MLPIIRGMSHEIVVRAGNRPILVPVDGAGAQHVGNVVDSREREACEIREVVGRKNAGGGQRKAGLGVVLIQKIDHRCRRSARRAGHAVYNQQAGQILSVLLNLVRHMRAHPRPELGQLVRPLERGIELNKALGVHPGIVRLPVIVGLQDLRALYNPRVYTVAAGFGANPAVGGQTVSGIFDRVGVKVVDFAHMVAPRAAILFKAQHLRAVRAHGENRPRENLRNRVQQIVIPGSQGGLSNRYKRRCIDNFTGRILAGSGLVDFSQDSGNVLKSHTNSHVYITSLYYLSAGG